MRQDTALLIHVRTQRPHAPRFQAELDALNDAAAVACEEAGLRPVLVPAAEAPAPQLLRAATLASVLVVLGGEDVTPALYGGASTYPGSGHHEPWADEVTAAAIRARIAARTPLLGICRGLQLLNVALGGTLVQDLPGHTAAARDPFVTTTLHPARAGYPLDLPHEVRCTHHQAVGALAPGLSVIARAVDGTIEAVAHTAAPALGVQFHPEHPEVASAQLTPLLTGLNGARMAHDAARATSA
jgi:putative glutamine amidotransferase